MNAGLTDQQLDELANDLLGTADSIDTALERIGLDPADFDMIDVEDALIDWGTERCIYCGWWMESCALNEDGVCEECVEDGWSE
jgi:hypothetical protein